MPSTKVQDRSTVDQTELDKFTAMADEWWDPTGKFKPLHKFNPIRLGYIREQVCAHFNIDPKQRHPFKNLDLLDIGCGGGLLCEPMTRLGATVTGIDPGTTNISIARTHSEAQGLEIDYQAITAEQLLETDKKYDVVLCMEVVEHVADVALFMESCSKLVKPGGLLFAATLNRTLKSFVLAIVGAEYVLRWLPKGTHQWDKFVTPEELKQAIINGGLEINETQGVTFNPITDQWKQSTDTDVNYMVLAHSPE